MVKNIDRHGKNTCTENKYYISRYKTLQFIAVAIKNYISLEDAFKHKKNILKKT